MRIIEVNNYDEMSVLTASILGAQVLLKPACVLGLATGTSPIGAYKELIKQNQKGVLDFSAVKTVNLDEYCGLAPENPNSYHYFMHNTLFDHINIDKKNTYLPDGMAVDKEAESRRYENLLETLGGVDLQLLGIGVNGHIGFNEPADNFPRFVHEVQLTESTIKANARLFDAQEQVPTTAVTMGIGTIMKSRKILLIEGERKKDILDAAIHGKITPEVPASILQMHTDVTVIMHKR